MRRIFLVASALALSVSLSGCLGAGAMMALSTAGGVVSIAKNVFDVDVDIHTLLGQQKPAAPIPPVVAVTQPQLLVTTPPANASLDGK